MSQINDQVLAAISLEYGINGQAPTADLLGTINTVVQASDFRIKYRLLHEVVTPGGGAGDVGFVYLAEDRKFERWKMIQLVVQNLTLDDATATLKLQELEGVAYTRLVMQTRANAGEFTILVGPTGIGSKGTLGGDSRGQIPDHVWIPSTENLVIGFASETPPFNQAVIAIDALIEVHPPEVVSDLVDASQVIVPGP